MKCEAYPMRHEPRAFLSNAKRAMNFIRRNPVLCSRDEPYRDNPLVQWNWAFLEDRSDLNRELLSTIFTVPAAILRKVVGRFRLVAIRAHRSIRPAEHRNELDAIVFVGEIQDRLLKCSGEVRFAHAKNYTA